MIQCVKKMLFNKMVRIHRLNTGAFIRETSSKFGAFHE